MKILTLILALPAVALAQLDDPAWLATATKPADVVPASSFYATYFTNAYATNILSGVANSQLGLVSFWFRREASSATATPFAVGAMRASMVGQEPGAIANNTSAAAVLFIYANGGPNTVAFSGWHHLLMSWDLSTEGRRQVFLDGTNRTGQIVFTAGEIVDLVGAGCFLASSTSLPNYSGSLSQVYFAVPSSYFDITSGSNLAKFWTARDGYSGGQVDLGSNGSTPLGVQPLLYWPGNAANWDNLGSGGGTFWTNSTGGFIVSTNAP